MSKPRTSMMIQTIIEEYEITTYWSGLEFIVTAVRLGMPTPRLFRALKCEVDAIKLHNKLIFLIDQRLYSEIANV